ncbi:MAG: hypothetical protein ACK4OO_02735 [bacterium]
MAIKCPSCHTYVTKIPINWKCPYCGERLPEPSKWFLFYESVVEALQDKGAIFWSVWFGIVLIFIGLVELLGGTSYLLSYLGNNILIAVVGIFFAGALIDMIAKINLPIRLPSGTDFILRERAAIRNIRKATNLAIMLGIAVSILWLGPKTFLEYFPAYLVVIAWFLSFAWSISGLFFDPRWMDDVRFRFFLERLGIFSIKRFRKICTYNIGALVAIAILFFVLMSIPGLWQKFRNLPIVGNVIHFIELYLSWLF